MNDARSTQSSGAARDATVATVIATIEGSSILVPAPTALGGVLTPPAAWAPRRSDNVDIEVLEWIASHVRGKRRRSGSLMTIAALALGTAAAMVAQPLASIVDFVV